MLEKASANVPLCLPQVEVFLFPSLRNRILITGIDDTNYNTYTLEFMKKLLPFFMVEAGLLEVPPNSIMHAGDMQKKDLLLFHLNTACP
jgi:hypothetical protein